MVVWIRVRIKISLVNPYVFPFGVCKWDERESANGRRSSSSDGEYR
jgi:hypothetical protein